MLRKRTQRLYREEGPTVRKRPTGIGRFFIAGDRHGITRRVQAPQRGLRCMGNLLCMGLFLRFAAIPTPRSFHHSDYRLPAGMDVDMLDGHLLLALAAMPVERLQQRRPCAGELLRRLLWPLSMSATRGP